MIDALFWYTGLAAWVLIVLGCGSLLAAEVHDRYVARRRSEFIRPPSGLI
jgi:hypothetical protein